MGGATMIIKGFLEIILFAITAPLVLAVFLISFVIFVIATVLILILAILILILAIPVVFAAALFKLFICKNNFLKNKKIISNICERIRLEFLEEERSDT